MEDKERMNLFERLGIRCAKDLWQASNVSNSTYLRLNHYILLCVFCW